MNNDFDYLLNADFCNVGTSSTATEVRHRIKDSIAAFKRLTEKMAPPPLHPDHVTRCEHLCTPIASNKPRRTHHRRRIQKKWAKRLGYIPVKCPGVCYWIVNIGYVACPHAFGRLAVELAALGEGGG